MRSWKVMAILIGAALLVALLTTGLVLAQEPTETPTPAPNLDEYPYGPWYWCPHGPWWYWHHYGPWYGGEEGRSQEREQYWYPYGRWYWYPRGPWYRYPYGRWYWYPRRP